MKKIENIHEALDVFNEHTYLGSAGWNLDYDGSAIYEPYEHDSFSAPEAISIANHLSGYYTALEAERDAMRQELRSRAEATVALTAEVERLRPVVEAVREEYSVRLEWAFAPNQNAATDLQYRKTLEQVRGRIASALADLSSKERES